MLTDQDIRKITNVFSTREEMKATYVTKEEFQNFWKKAQTTFVTKDEFGELKQEVSEIKEMMQSLLLFSDRLTKSMEDLKMEYVAMS